MPTRASTGVLLGAGGLALLLGLTGALVLLGLPMPQAALRLGEVHGLLMAFGFLGTLVALERAVALGRGWAYLAPAASIAGAAALVGGDAPLASLLFVIAGLVFVLIYVVFDRRERSLHGGVQAIGALAWLGGAILLAIGETTADLVPWLAAFLILTILGERLELSRVLRPSERARRAFVVATVIFAAGILMASADPVVGGRLAGLGMLALAAWLGRNDLARRTIRARGVTRFIAASLLPGYMWLAAAGAIWLWFGVPQAGHEYDAGLHAIFLGFVMSMVFGHAPVILPAVLRLPLPYRPRFYAHLLLLHLGLVIRIVGGDGLGTTAAWQLGGVLNVTAVLVFLLSSVAAVMEGWRERRGAAPSDRTAREAPPTTA